MPAWIPQGLSSRYRQWTAAGKVVVPEERWPLAAWMCGRERHILRRCKYSVADESTSRAKAVAAGVLLEAPAPRVRGKWEYCRWNVNISYGMHLVQDRVDGDLPNN